MNIEYPSTEERDQSISYIIEKAYHQKENVFSYLYHLYCRVGMKFLLGEMRKLYVVVLILYGGLILAGQSLEDALELHSYVGIVALAPIAFQMVLGLSLLNEQEQNTYELQMTCKYTLYHVLALRMIVAGVFAVMMNAAFCLFVYGNRETAFFLRVLFLSVTALLGYSLIYLTQIMKNSRIKYQVGLYGMWIAGNMVLAACFPKGYLFLAARIPLLLHVILWVALIGLWGRKMSQYLYCNCRYNLSEMEVVS